MSSSQAIVFVDLVNSTSAFEKLGNEVIATSMAKLTRWISRTFERFGGRVIKLLGDGVLGMFADPAAAARACIAIQTQHASNLDRWPEPMRMGLRMGLALGPVTQVSGEFYGEAINLAARLCAMATPNTILTTAPVVRQISDQPRPPLFRSLGEMDIRGLSHTHMVYRMEWRPEASTDFIALTAPMQFADTDDPAPPPRPPGICLTRPGASATFGAQEMPLIVGRAAQCHFVMPSPLVSRQHLRIEYRHGSLVLTDTSTYGTWVREEPGAGPDLCLRHNSCALHQRGTISLGGPPGKGNPPCVQYEILQDNG